MICAGIDAGSRAIKIVCINKTSLEVIAQAQCPQGSGQKQLADALLQRMLAENHLQQDSICTIIATGYGRSQISQASTAITEISCHSRGVYEMAADARTIIEIGGQDSKIIHLDENGKARDFSMNDRCAAGTGRFLEVVAERLSLNLAELGLAAAKSSTPAPISSMCVVFAETEIVNLLAEGRSLADIAAGIELSIANRISALLGSRFQEKVYFTGGVALVGGMQEALAKVLQKEIIIAKNPQYTGAYGAALLAAEQAGKN